MKPQTQATPMRTGPNGESGDCFRTCVAMILDMDRDDVPNFMEYGADRWFTKLAWWLRPMGLNYFEVALDQDGKWPLGIHTTDKQLVIGCGQSPCGEFGHAAVYEMDAGNAGIRFRLEHDPFPNSEGIPKVTEIGMFMAIRPHEMNDR